MDIETVAFIAGLFEGAMTTVLLVWFLGGRKK